MYVTVQQWKWNNLNPIELGWHVKENMMVPVKQINQWLRGAFLNFCLVVAKLVVAKHVDAVNSDYITLLCGVHSSFIHSCMHSFIHFGHFYSAPSSPLLLRGAPDRK